MTVCGRTFWTVANVKPKSFIEAVSANVPQYGGSLPPGDPTCGMVIQSTRKYETSIPSSGRDYQNVSSTVSCNLTSGHTTAPASAVACRSPPRPYQRVEQSSARSLSRLVSCLASFVYISPSSPHQLIPSTSARLVHMTLPSPHELVQSTPACLDHIPSPHQADQST